MRLVKQEIYSRPYKIFYHLINLNKLLYQEALLISARQMPYGLTVLIKPYKRTLQSYKYLGFQRI